MDTDQPIDQPGGMYQPAEISADTERELALRMIASRAIVDATFYDQLRENPRAAIEQLHISLPEEDLRRFSDVDWNKIDEHVEVVRNELGFGRGLRGAW